ncbi:MAG: dihydroneopterin aldolase [Zetaproteobacteria bacterium]|nr:dihydroneopterin aldolase [Zetaproteobacteria bacterium]
MHIHIKGYPVFVKLGVFDTEQLYGQEIFVDLSLKLHQMESQLHEDDAPPSLDYGAVLRAVDACLQGKSFKLIETALYMLGKDFRTRFPQILSAQYSIHKPVLPGGIDKGAHVSISAEFCYIDDTHS